MINDRVSRKEIFNNENRIDLSLYLDVLKTLSEELREEQRKDRDTNRKAIETLNEKVTKYHIDTLEKIDIYSKRFEEKCDRDKRELDIKIQENKKEIDKNKSKLDRIFFYSSGIATSGATLLGIILKKVGLS